MAQGNKGGKKERKPLPADEVQAAKAVESFNKAHEGKTLNDKQKVEKKELQDKLGALRFVRIANKRIPRTLAAIAGIASLGAKQYVKSDAQVKAISKALREAVEDACGKLAGAKASAGGFTLPGFTDAPEQKQ